MFFIDFSPDGSLVARTVHDGTVRVGFSSDPSAGDSHPVILDIDGKTIGGPDSEAFQETIQGILDQNKKHVLVNLEKVNWINSTGLGLIVSAYSTLVKNGGRMKACEVSDRIDNILHVTQLELLFETFDKEGEALGSFEAMG